MYKNQYDRKSIILAGTMDLGKERQLEDASKNNKNVRSKCCKKERLKKEKIVFMGLRSNVCRCRLSVKRGWKKGLGVGWSGGLVVRTNARKRMSLS